MKSVRTSVILLVFILLVMPPVTASETFDMFVQIEGIKGDSTDQNHQGWFDVLSFEHDLSQPKGDSPALAQPLSAGRAEQGEFQITKRFDSASPLAEHLQIGESIPTVTFELCGMSKGEYTTYAKFAQKNAKVVEVKSSDEFTEVRFRYGEIHWEYTPTVTGDGDDIPITELYEDGILKVNSEKVNKGNKDLLLPD